MWAAMVDEGRHMWVHVGSSGWLVVDYKHVSVCGKQSQTREKWGYVGSSG